MTARRGGWRRDLSKERHWRRMLRRWRSSGLSVRDFCDWQNLPEPSFYAWRREIAKRDREAAVPRARRAGNGGRRASAANAVAGASPEFVPVRVVADEPAVGASHGHSLELRLPTGVELRVPPGFDRQTLIDVLAALEGAQSC